MLEISGIIIILAWIGGTCVYVSGGGLTGTSAYKLMKNKTNEDVAVVFAVLAGILWPIVIPVGFVIGAAVRLMEGLVYSGGGKETNEPEDKISNKAQEIIDSSDEDDDEDEEEDDEDEEEEEPVCPFKVGDLVTGVEGNPEGNTHLYEGCVLRVVETNEDEFDGILVDHIDKEAHQSCLGDRFTSLNVESYKLVPKPKARKRKAVKKKPVKKIAKKKR